MVRFLPCPWPCHSQKHQEFDQVSHETNLHYSDSSINSSSRSLNSSSRSFASQLNSSSRSFASQLNSSSRSFASLSSLASVPSLTPHSQTQEHAASSSSAAPATAHHHCLATLKGHSAYVFSLALAGKHLYSGASKGEIRVWDCHPSPASPHNHTVVVSDAHSSVKSIVVLGGDRLITAHHDHKIRVWRIDTKPPPPPHRQRYRLIATLPTVSDRWLRVCSGKNYVEVRRHKLSMWVQHVDAVSALSLSRDGALLYSVSWDRSFKVWRTSDFKCVESVQNAHDDAINAVVLSSDGFVYTGSADRTIKAWKKPAGDTIHSLVAVLAKHKSAVNALALSSDGSVLYSGACDRSIIVWEKGEDGGGATHMAVAGALRGHKKAILCLAVVSDLLCSGSADKTVRVWRRGSGNSYSCLAVLEGHKSPIKCLTAALDNNNNDNNNHKNDYDNSYLVYSGSLDFDIKVWQIWVPS